MMIFLKYKNKKQFKEMKIRNCNTWKVIMSGFNKNNTNSKQNHLEISTLN